MPSQTAPLAKDQRTVPMYLILHGFSRRNAGDGLLVDLTLEALAEAGIERQDCALLALDPGSFADLAHVYRAPGEPTARPSLRLGLAGLELLADPVSLGQVARVIVDLIFHCSAVAGGKQFCRASSTFLARLLTSVGSTFDNKTKYSLYSMWIKTLPRADVSRIALAMPVKAPSLPPSGNSSKLSMRICMLERLYPPRLAWSNSRPSIIFRKAGP